jgi:hypothetical protein
MTEDWALRCSLRHRKKFSTEKSGGVETGSYRSAQFLSHPKWVRQPVPFGTVVVILLFQALPWAVKSSRQEIRALAKF